MTLLNRIPLRWLLGLCVLPFLFCSFFNLGFFASDEYWTGITRYIPAQMSSVKTLVGTDDVKAPSQLLPFHGLAQLGEILGLTRPFSQYRFVIAVLGCVSTALLFLAFFNLPLGPRGRRVGLVLLGFHFVSAIAFTRPMFEATSAPFVALAAAAALWYERLPRFHFLMWGILASTVAFLLRPQAGIVAVTFLILPLWRRSWVHFAGAAAVGVAAFVAAGIFDGALVGAFHGSLRRLISYNADHGADYGTQPFFFFVPVLLAATLMPWLLSSLTKDSVLRQWGRQRAAILMLALFIAEHSIFPNKFERFLVPILPVVLILMIAPVRDLLTPGRSGMFRRAGFVGLNALLFVGAVFFEPQGPLLDLVRFTNSHPEIRGLANIDQTVTWYPDVFQDRPVPVRPITLGEVRTLACDEVIVARQSQAEAILRADPKLVRRAEVSPGPIDWLAYKLNPKHNARRSPLVLIGCGVSAGGVSVRSAVL